MNKCRITVLKTTFNKDLVDLYVENERKKTLGTCEVFKEGQEFITDVVIECLTDFVRGLGMTSTRYWLRFSPTATSGCGIRMEM